MNNENLTDVFSFAGHETFGFRQLWPMKAVCHVLNTRKDHCFSYENEDVITELGLGKNMIKSMRFWALASGLLEHSENTIKVSSLGKTLFSGDCPLDAYGENPTTAWIIHWNLAKNASKFTAIWFLFNKMNKTSITRTEFFDALMEFTVKANHKVSSNTLQRDVNICFRSYAPYSCIKKTKQSVEDATDPLLAEIGLLSSVEQNRVEMLRAERPTLAPGMFIYALEEYWESRPDKTATLSFNSLDDIGAPGRVFKLSEKAIYDYLENIENLTNGAMSWSEQQGIRCVIRRDIALDNPTRFKNFMLHLAYRQNY